MAPEMSFGDDEFGGPPPEFLRDLLKAAGRRQRPEPNRTPAQQMTKHRMPEAEVIVEQLSTVSEQPGYGDLYKTVADQLALRLVNGADMVGTLLTAVVHHVEHEEPVVKSIAHTLVQDWIIALSEGDSEFEIDAGRFFAHVLMGTVAVQHLSAHGGHTAEL